MRRRLLAALVCALALGTVLFAIETFEQVVVDNTVGGVPLTATKIAPPGQKQMQRGACRVRTAEISFTHDGTAPTTTVGTLAEVGDMIYLPDFERLTLFRAIRTTAVSGQLDCNYTP